jgi:hypothetical protein
MYLRALGADMLLAGMTSKIICSVGVLGDMQSSAVFAAGLYISCWHVVNAALEIARLG